MKILVSSLLALWSLSSFADCSLQVTNKLPYELVAELREKNFTLTFDENTTYKSKYVIQGWYPNMQTEDGTMISFEIFREIPNAPKEVIFAAHKTKAGSFYDITFARERTQKTDRDAIKKVVKALRKLEPCY